MMFNKKAYHPLKRAMALLLVLVLISTTMVFPIDPASAVAETPDPAAIDIAATAGTAITDGFITSYNMVADPDTSNTQFGSVGLATPTPVWNNTTAQDGRLWADKSVNVYSASIYDVSGLPVSTVTAAPDEFLVTLSAQSQAFQVDTTILTPSDTVFVIDVSGSMAVNEVGTSGLTRVAVLVQALNSAIEQLMTANPNNRIAVVAFGGHVVSNANATEIINVLPLASYTQVTNGQFFTLTNSTTITVSSQITNPGSRTIPVGGGTPTQRGIYAGAQILLSANTTYSTTVGGVPYDLTRTPNIVLLTDGEPTFGWVDYAFNTAPTDTNFTVGNGTAADMGLSLLTVLTASAMRQLVHDHYFGPTDMTSSVGFFNIGIGDTSIYTDGALNPYGSTGNAANPSQVNADMVSQTFSGVTYNMRTLLDSFAAGNAITLPILNRNSSTVYALQTLTNSVMVNGVATPGYIRTCNYATFAITGVNNAQEIVDIFSNVADTIISQGSYITRAGGDPDFTGYVIFSDIVGQYMQFRTGYGLWVNNVLNDGSAFAAELATSPTLQQTLAQSIVDSQTSVVVGVQNPINITQALSLVQSSIAAGAGNAVVYYTDNNRQWLQNYYSSTGAVLSPPAGAYAITRRYTSQGSIENVVTGEMTDIMNVAFYVITVITPGQFTGVYSSPTDLVRELGVGDQIVRLYIPASLIPMRSVTEDATTGQIQVVEAVPLRFIYSVGIDVDRTLTYLPTDTTYIAANGVPGDYVYLYTNRWQEYANLALVYFQPNVANPYYPVGAPPDNAPAEVANITQTNPYIWEDFAFLDTNGDQVFVKYFGNNGRLELPFTNAQVIKEWDPRLNNLAGQGAPGGLIAPEYVQLYDSEGLPVGAPVLLTPDWSSVTDPTTEGPYATYTWTNIPLYDLLPDASGNAVPMTFSVLEGDMQGAVFVPYTTAGGTNDPGFDIVYMQPVWDAGTNTWQLTIANTYRVEGQWFVLLSKEFEGLPPSAIPANLTIDIFPGVAGSPTFYTPIRATYPGDFNNGTAMIPVTPYMVGGNMPSTIAFVEYFIDGNDGYGTIYGANVAGYTWVLHTTNLSVSPATAPLPTDTVGFYDPTGTNDIGYIAELTGIEAGSIVQVTLVNTYTPDAAPAITIDKNIGGSVGWGDIFNTQFVVQRYADAAGTTPVGAPTIVPLSAFTQTGAGSGEFVLPGTLPAGFYSITELGAEVAFIAGDTTEHVQNLVSSSFVLTVGNPNAGTPDEVRNPNAANIYWLGSGDVATFTFTNTYAQNAALIVNKVIDAVDANGAAMSPSAVAPMAMVFNITNANNALVAQFTYDMFINNQYILTGLPAGTYTITESGGAASGFSGPVVSVTSGGTTTAGNSATFTIGDGLPDVTLTFTNTYTQISNVFDLQVQKLFSGISLAAIPADFELVITGSGGFTQNISLLNAIFGTTLLNLPLGTYTISEANADVAGYTRTVSVYDVTGTVVSQVLPYSFTASQGGAQLSFAIFNEYAIIPPVTGSLVIEKDFVGLTTATTSPSAISFVVQGTDAVGNEVYRNTVMYSDFVGGSYTLTNLPVGNYTIVENGGLVAGYLLTVLPSATQTVPVYPGETTIVAFTNSYTALPPTDLPSLTIQKVFHGLLPDEQPQTMTITITNPQGAEDSYDFAQILAGIVLEAIALGDYIIDELNADVEGFNMTTTVEVQGLNIAQPTGLPATIPITSATDDVLVIINNFYTPETFALRLQKTFAGLTASQIPANFALVLTNTDGFRQTIGLADAMAGITIPGLTVGMYTVAEINAAVSGFTFTANPAMPHTFTVDEGGQLITLNITNTYTASGTQPPVTPPAPPAPPPRPPGTPLAPPTTTPYIPWEPRGPGQTGDEGADEATDATDETPTDDEPTDAYIIIAIHVPTHIHHAYMVGYAEDGTIRPHANITRAEVTTIFFRLISDHQRANIWSQTNSFDDVPLARWFNNPISTMENGGLFAGMPLAAEPNFYPNQAATRAEFAAMVVNFIGLGHYQNVQADAFTDTAGHWAEDAINTAFLQGWIRGYGDGTFRPDQLITRAEVAALVNRAMGRLPQTVDDLLPGMVTWPDNMDQSRWYYLYIQEATNTHYYYRKADGVHETWARLLPPRDWRRLERPYSTPWDLYPY